MSNTTDLSQRLIAIQTNMFNFAYMLTSNRDDANDLVQDTALKVLSNQDKFSDNSNFKGWVLTIMRNIFINNYRKAVRTSTVIDRSTDLYQLNLPQDSGLQTPEGAITVSEVTDVLNQFEKEYRDPFMMHLKGYKYAEIAEYTHIPIGTVKSRIFFARQRLQKILKDMRY